MKSFAPSSPTVDVGVCPQFGFPVALSNALFPVELELPPPPLATATVIGRVEPAKVKPSKFATAAAASAALKYRTKPAPFFHLIVDP